MKLKCARIRLKAVHLKAQHAYCRREARGAFVERKCKHKVRKSLEVSCDNAFTVRYAVEPRFEVDLIGNAACAPIGRTGVSQQREEGRFSASSSSYQA